MNLWERGTAETFESRQKHQEEFPRCCLIYQLFGFSKKGTCVSERDIQLDEETVVIAQYSTYFDKEIYELPICYTKIINWEFRVTQTNVYFALIS